MPESRVSAPPIPTRDPSAAWLFPELVLALAPTHSQEIAIAAGARTRLLVPNPRRIGVVFITPVSDAGGTFVSPFVNADVYGFPIAVADRVLAFAVDDLYSLVPGAWYGYHAAGVTLKVVEFIKPA